MTVEFVVLETKLNYTHLLKISLLFLILGLRSASSHIRALATLLEEASLAKTQPTSQRPIWLNHLTAASNATIEEKFEQLLKLNDDKDANLST